MYHYRRNKIAHDQLRVVDLGVECPFPICNKNNTQEILYQNDTMAVIRNRTPYELFEAREVTDHIMVIPKRHLESLADFTDKELVDMTHIAARYEKEGYNVYARGLGALTRSVRHQHTHLIKAKGERAHAMLYISSPYFVARL